MRGRGEGRRKGKGGREGRELSGAMGIRHMQTEKKNTEKRGKARNRRK